MRNRFRDEDDEEFTFADKLKGIGLVGIPLWVVLFFLCVAGVNECIDRHSKKTPSSPPYRIEEVNNHLPIEHTPTGEKRSLKPVESKENKMIEELSRRDYYEILDYYDGLDGEYNDIDYNEIRDYFED